MAASLVIEWVFAVSWSHSSLPCYSQTIAKSFQTLHRCWPKQPNNAGITLQDIYKQTLNWHVHPAVKTKHQVKACVETNWQVTKLPSKRTWLKTACAILTLASASTLFKFFSWRQIVWNLHLVLKMNVLFLIWVPVNIIRLCVAEN